MEMGEKDGIKATSMMGITSSGSNENLGAML